MLFDLVVIFLFIIFFVIGIFQNPIKSIIQLGFYLIFTYIFYQLIYFIILLILNNNSYFSAAISNIVVGFDSVNLEINSYSSMIGEKLLVFDDIYGNPLYLNKVLQAFIYTISFCISSIISFILSYVLGLLIYLKLKKKGKLSFKNNKKRYISSSIISFIFLFLVFSMTISPYQSVANNLYIVNEIAYSINLSESLKEEEKELNENKILYQKTNAKYQNILNEYDEMRITINEYSDQLMLYLKEYYEYNDSYKEFINERENIDETKVNSLKLNELDKKLYTLNNDLIILKEKMDENSTIFSTFNGKQFDNYYNIYGNLFLSNVNNNQIDEVIVKFKGVDSLVDEYLSKYFSFINKIPSLKFLDKIFSINYGYGIFFKDNKLTTLNKEMSNFKENYNNLYQYDMTLFKKYLNELLEESNEELASLNDSYKEKEEAYKEVAASYVEFKENEDDFLDDYRKNLDKIKSEVEDIKTLLSSF